MTLIKADDLYNALMKIGQEKSRPDLYMLAGFLQGMVDKAPRYEIPDNLLKPFFKEGKT